jgi:hypothetical protein
MPAAPHAANGQPGFRRLRKMPTRRVGAGARPVDGAMPRAWRPRSPRGAPRPVGVCGSGIGQAGGLRLDCKGFSATPEARHESAASWEATP